MDAHTKGMEGIIANGPLHLSRPSCARAPSLHSITWSKYSIEKIGLRFLAILWEEETEIFVQKYYSCGVNRCVFWAVNTPKMRLWSTPPVPYTVPPDPLAVGRGLATPSPRTYPTVGPKGLFAQPFGPQSLGGRGAFAPQGTVPPRFSGLEPPLL